MHLLLLMDNGILIGNYKCTLGWTIWVYVANVQYVMPGIRKNHCICGLFLNSAQILRVWDSSVVNLSLIMPTTIWVEICLISSHLLNTKPVRTHQYDPMMNTWTKWFYSYLNYQYKFSFNRLIYHVLGFKHLFSIFSCQFSKNKFPAACVISVIRTNYCKLCLQERKLIK